MIGAGLGLVRAMGSAIGEAGAAYLRMKEVAGQERAAISALFASVRYDLATSRRLATPAGDQANFADRSHSNAAPSQIASLDAAEASAPAREVTRLREILLSTMPGDAPAFRDASAWFAIVSQRIDTLKEVDDGLTNELVAHAHSVRASAERMPWLWAGGAFAVLLALAGIAVAFGTAISRPLNRITRRDCSCPASPHSTGPPGFRRSAWWSS